MGAGRSPLYPFTYAPVGGSLHSTVLEHQLIVEFLLATGTATGNETGIVYVRLLSTLRVPET